MGELLTFERGCNHCENLVRVGKNTYVCNARAHMDDTDVVPIRDGKHTDDWNICNGEDYHYFRTLKSHTTAN